MDNSNFTAHKENSYNDFDYEGLIYKKLSQEGPSLAVGDVDGDGNEDIFVGGAKGHPGFIYRHRGNGSFRISKQPVFDTDSEYEDVSAAFLDSDGDGDLDLIVGSGGNEFLQERKYRPRLYLNDGKGNFSASDQLLPSAFKNIAVIAPCDFDQDGDTDVFIGSRSIVGVYGPNPDHLLLENREGQFVDATQRKAYELKDEGMVTHAIWADMDGDDKQDLITVSDWDTPKNLHQLGQEDVKNEFQFG